MNNNVLVGSIAFVAGAVISPLVVTWLLVRYAHKTLEDAKQKLEKSREVELPVWGSNRNPIITIPINTSTIDFAQCEDGLKNGSVVEL